LVIGVFFYYFHPPTAMIRKKIKQKPTIHLKKKTTTKKRSLLLILTQLRTYVLNRFWKRIIISATQFRSLLWIIEKKKRKNDVHSRRICFNAITISKRKYPVFSAVPRQRYATRYVCNCAIPNDSPEPYCYCLLVKGTV